MEPQDSPDFTHPTTPYWQTLYPPSTFEQTQPSYRYGYPVRLPDGRYLELPIRKSAANPQHAVASFIANHASFEVVEVLADFMADLTRAHAPEIIVGLPTLGLVFAPMVARRLGFHNYVPMGYSRKYWYDEALSVPVRSITSPDAHKRLYLDPHLLPRVQGRRVVVMDDAISTGQTTAAALALAQQVGAEVCAVVVAMIQGDRWKSLLATQMPGWKGEVCGVFYSPRLVWVEEGWVPE